MNQKLLSFLIIICSLFSGALAAIGILYISNTHDIFKDTNIVNTPEQNTPITPQEIEWPATNISSSTMMQSLESEIIATVQNVSESIVSIVIKKDLIIYKSDPYGFFQQPIWSISRQVGGWSWFFIKNDGTILTNKHVVADPSAAYTVILSDGSELDAKVLALDPINDLAVIKINDTERKFKSLEIAKETSDIQIGQFTIAVGNALAEFQNSVSLGIVSGKNRMIEAGWDRLTGLIQTDAAINPGNSGWPLMSLDGHVIGINTAIASNSNGIGFAFALSQARIDYILKSITTSGRIKRPFIGINYIPNSPDVAQELWLPIDYGVYIINQAGSIVIWSSADIAGLEPGDIILSVNNEKINGDILSATIQNSLPGEILSLTVLKNSWEQVDLNLQLWES